MSRIGSVASLKQGVCFKFSERLKFRSSQVLGLIEVFFSAIVTADAEAAV
jgi:hypothetical protein